MKKQKQPKKQSFFGVQKRKAFLANQKFLVPQKFIKYSKEAQLYSQIFVYILTTVLIAFILGYGYNAVQNFNKRAEQVSCLKFKNDLQSAIESISSDFGSIKRKDLQLCAGYIQACFVETYESPNIPAGIDPFMKGEILSGTGNNVFLIDGGTPESFSTGEISVNPDVFCIKASNNKISLRLEGKGNYALLSQWT